MKQLGEFNRMGAVETQELKDAEVGETGLEGRVRLGNEVGSDEEVEAAALEHDTPTEFSGYAEVIEEETVDEAAPAAEVETVDADPVDGHDDNTGQFVEGNQEAADPAGDEVA